MPKRPAFRKNDRVTLSSIRRSIPSYEGKPAVLRDTVLTVSHITGTGTARNPFHVSVTDGEYFWHLEPDDIVKAEPSAHSVKKQLDEWLDTNGYPTSHARKVREAPTERRVFAAHERDHHITTSGRRDLTASQFALPPGPEEKRRGIKGRFPIDTLARARNALARAAQQRKSGHLSASQLATVKRKVHAAWPSVVESP
jgi:hypothetical protein